MKKWKYLITGFIFYVLVISLIGLIEKGNEGSNIQSITDAFWYAFVTLTTVGYGDYFPVTVMGKLLGLTLIVGSIGILGFIVGEINTRFSLYMEKKKTGFFGTDFTKHYIIIGWNDFGRQVAEQIINTGHRVVFIVNSKNDLELVQDVFKPDCCFCMFADYNNMQAYNKANIEQSKGVFINFKDDSETLVFVLNLKKMFPTVDIVVAIHKPSLKETFINAGIQHVISQEEVASRLVASYVFEPHVAAYTEDLITTSFSDSDFDLQQYRILESNKNVGQKYFDTFLKLKKELGAVTIGLVRDGLIDKNPDNDYKIKAGDYLILISDGHTKKLLENEFGIKEGE